MEVGRRGTRPARSRPEGCPVPGTRPTITVLDPADGSLVGELDVASPTEVETAVASARKAAPEWARTAPAERAARVAAAARAGAASAGPLGPATTRAKG